MSHVHTLADRASDQGHMPTHSTAQPQICLDLKKKKKNAILYIYWRIQLVSKGTGPLIVQLNPKNALT